MVICISGFARYSERHKMFALCKPGRRPTNMDTKYTQTKNCIVKMKSKLSSMHSVLSLAWKNIAFNHRKGRYRSKDPQLL